MDYQKQAEGLANVDPDIALVFATLELAHQQSIANKIALLSVGMSSKMDADWIRLAKEGFGII